MKCNVTLAIRQGVELVGQFMDTMAKSPPYKFYDARTEMIANTHYALLASMLILGVPSELVAQDAIQTAGTITVVGQATLEVVPDRIDISFAVDSWGDSASEASKKGRETCKAVTEFLKNQGLEARDLQTEAVRLKPIYREKPIDEVDPFDLSKSSIEKSQATNVGARDYWSRISTPVGYKASRSMVVRIRDPDKFEAIQDGILQQGVTEINSVQRIRSDMPAWHEKATLLAVKAAKEKAAKMAKVVDEEIERVLTIQEFDRGSMSLIISTTSDVAETDGFAEGVITIERKVKVVFELAQK